MFRFSQILYVTVYVPAGVLAGTLRLPSVPIVTPVSPPSFSTVIVISLSVTAIPFNVSFVVTSPATPPTRPFIGVEV